MRGGPNNRGKVLANNTSGLAGIRFEWRPSRDGQWLYAYVCASWTDGLGVARRGSWSIEQHGRAGALTHAIESRHGAGLTVPRSTSDGRAQTLPGRAMTIAEAVGRYFLFRFRRRLEAADVHTVALQLRKWGVPQPIAHLIIFGIRR